LGQLPVHEAILTIKSNIIKNHLSLNQIDRSGHLYGAIIASVRDYIELKKKGRYAEYHLAYAAHYSGDLSQPLHHTLYEDFNRRYHSKMDGIVNDDVIDKFSFFSLKKLIN
jgi:hypothetical protein